MHTPSGSHDDDGAGPLRIGIDTGGTFTDFLIVEGQGDEARAEVRKLPSTPSDPSMVILAALATLSRPPSRLVHGSTVATNALLEGTGAHLAWITTAGFRDLIEIGRQDRPHLYDPQRVPDPPPVPRSRRLEARERLGPRGEEWQPLTDEECERLRRAVETMGVEAIAVGLLHSTIEPRHERRIADALRPLGLPVILSSELVAEPREFERFATALASASVTPVMDRYLARLGEGLEPGSWSVMESSGGSMPWERLRGQAIRTVLSGPAGGVVAASRWAKGSPAGAIAFDMGGTSTDVTLVPPPRPGDPPTVPTTREFRLGTWPVAVPVVDGQTVGAGGGSLAWIDGGGALRVGPRSAGADPGPICYGNGGRTPTVTDAHFLLGRIPSDVRLGGEMPLTAAGLEEAFTSLGGEIGLGPRALARGIIRVVEAEMERALRRITQERGIDPRGLDLISFGGAGGLHAVALARSLGAREVIVPPDPGILSATGMLEAPEIEFGERTILAPWSAEMPARLAEAFEGLERGARERLGETGGGEVIIRGELGVRLMGQSHDLPIPWAPGCGDPRNAFRDAYRARFGVEEPQRELEITALRVRVEVPAAPLPIRAAESGAGSASAACRVLVDDGVSEALVEVPRVPRPLLSAASPLSGPALVEERTSTLWIPPGARLRRGREGELRIDPRAE